MPAKKTKKVTSGLQAATSEVIDPLPEAYVPPLDLLVVRIHSLRLCFDEKRYYAIKVSFMDNTIVSAVIKPSGPRVLTKAVPTIAQGEMYYDPSDYEKMCYYANKPLIVHVIPLMESYENMTVPPSPSPRQFTEAPEEKQRISKTFVSCCNVDILPLFIETDKLCVKKRLEPEIKPNLLHCSSWDNLPLITMGITVERNPLNKTHHDYLKNANYLKITMIGAYNVFLPQDLNNAVCMAASKVTFPDETNTTVVTYNNGYVPGKRFDELNFYPRWESCIVEANLFTKSDDKIACPLEKVYNETKIDLEHYLHKMPRQNCVVWRSFHRSLLPTGREEWFRQHILRWRWPLEVHLYSDDFEGCSYMAALNLFPLLYAGVDRVVLAVPLQFLNPTLMLATTGVEVLSPLPRVRTIGVDNKAGKRPKDNSKSSVGTGESEGGTGVDGSPAFVLVEVLLGRPLVQVSVPPYISNYEIKAMLKELEKAKPQKRQCTGRGQQARDWNSTVQSAANAIRRLPRHGIMEYCHFTRQFSETRTRVQVLTSFAMEGAIFVNNNFNVGQYVGPEHSAEKYQELLLMAHVVLTHSAVQTLVEPYTVEIDPTLRAARHARQLQDIPHAMELYLQVVEKPYSAPSWRELATCIKEVDPQWAVICLDESLRLGVTDHLTLLSEACTVFDENPDSAEPFFRAILALYPFWVNGWVVTSVYYMERELFRLADEVLECINLTRSLDLKNVALDLDPERSWESELGDWWEAAPPLKEPVDIYYDAADLLLRLRCMSLAETCLAKALAEHKATPQYFYYVALCCRLRGSVDDALCQARTGLNKFGDVPYLNLLEAECLHAKGEISESQAAFQKTSSCMTPYRILMSLPGQDQLHVNLTLTGLVRRMPSAYAWVAFCTDWLERAQIERNKELTDDQTELVSSAGACAVQALKIDRRSGRAWALLAMVVQPPPRRNYCIEMAIECGYPWLEAELESVWSVSAREAICARLGVPLAKCGCAMCPPLVA